MCVCAHDWYESLKLLPKKTRRGGFWWFLLRGISYPRLRLGCQSELFVVCIYGFCVFDQVTPILTASTLPDCPFPYSWPNRSCVRPIIKKRYSDKCLGRSALFSNEYTITIGNPITRKIPSKSLSIYISILISFMVDLAGTAPASWILFSLLHTVLNLLHYLNIQS